MEYTKLGSTGLDVSRLCLGTWRFGRETDGVLETDREEAHAVLDAFADRGGNFLDTANSYGGGDSERWIGEWLDDRDREDYVVASKVYWARRGTAFPIGRALDSGARHKGPSRKVIRAEIEGTLDRLGTDYLDLYYVHAWDDEVPIRETLATMDRFVREGTVRYLGLSNAAAWQLTKALWTSDVEGLERFEVTQPRYSAAYREAPAEHLDACADQGLAVCPYSPLEGGLLTGKYERGEEPPEGSRGALDDWGDRFEERQWRVLDAIRAVADGTAATPAQVSLRWLMDRERFTCVPIVGARTVEQVAENVGAVDVSLSAAQRERITDAYE